MPPKKKQDSDATKSIGAILNIRLTLSPPAVRVPHSCDVSPVSLKNCTGVFVLFTLLLFGSSKCSVWFCAIPVAVVVRPRSLFSASSPAADQVEQIKPCVRGFCLTAILGSSGGVSAVI